MESGESSERVLTYNAGRLHFAWRAGARDIEIYTLTHEGRPNSRLGFLVSRRWWDLNELVDFEQEAFEEHCQRFLSDASITPIPDEADD